MKPENLNEKMTENVRELNVGELDGVSGGDSTGKAVIGVAAGGVTMLVGDAIGAALSQVIMNVAAKYQ